MKDYNIGQKFAFFSTKEKFEKAQELTNQGYEFEVKFTSTLCGDIWVLQITGYIDTAHTTKKNGVDDDELLPCPFCGATENKKVGAISGLVLTKVEDIFQIFCFDCCCSSDYFRTEKEARQRWNMRVKERGGEK